LAKGELYRFPRSCSVTPRTAPRFDSACAPLRMTRVGADFIPPHALVAHIARHTTCGGYASYRVRLCRTYHDEQSEAYHAPKAPIPLSPLWQRQNFTCAEQSYTKTIPQPPSASAPFTQGSLFTFFDIRKVSLHKGAFFRKQARENSGKAIIYFSVRISE